MERLFLIQHNELATDDFFSSQANFPYRLARSFDAGRAELGSNRAGHPYIIDVVDASALRAFSTRELVCHIKVGARYKPKNTPRRDTVTIYLPLSGNRLDMRIRCAASFQLGHYSTIAF